MAMTSTYFEVYICIFLVLFIRATASSSNETSLDRRQSRVTGRIVKLYSGTRPEPILCAGEGFQADPRDCAVFYRCMKSGHGKYTVFRFQCGPGTIYDPETEVCNHPQSTKRSECGGFSPPLDHINTNEIDRNQNEIPSPITNRPVFTEIPKEIQNALSSQEPWVSSSSSATPSTKRQIPEVFTTSPSSYPWLSSTGPSYVDHKVNPFDTAQYTEAQSQQYDDVTKINLIPSTSAVPQSNSRDNICTSDGFMGDNENCRKFYRCVASQRGTYSKFEFFCSESTIWDDDTQSCNHAWAVKRSRCGKSNQNQFTTENTVIQQKDKPKDNSIQQQLQVSYGSKVTQTQTQISNGSVIQNQTQIHYGDRINQDKGAQSRQNQTQISHGAVSQIQTQIDYSNKGVQTQLQIDHSQQSSQIQVQVHESTTSKASTSTDSPINNGGTQENNKCQKSGFMGDINDCSKFYRCIENGKGGFTKFEFSCGEGTVWDQNIEACNHAWAVKDCNRISSGGTTSTTQNAISTSLSTQTDYSTVSTENYQISSESIDTEDNEDSSYSQQNQETTTTTTTSTTALSSTTVALSQTKLPSKGDCQSSGFIGHANDCKIFYRCVDNGRGSYTKYEFKCGEGTFWDPELEACNHAWAVKNCGGNAITDINKVETTTLNQNTPSTSYTQIVTQSTTETPPIQNDDYDTGYGPVYNDFTSSTASTTITTKQPQHVEQNTNSDCQTSGFIGDKIDCKKFYRCVDNGNGAYTRYEFSCGEGTLWDPKIEACNHAWAVEKCGGVTPEVHTTQSKPIVVSSSSTESIQNTDASTFIPSSTHSTSIITESVSSDNNDCVRSGFIGDQKDCKKFYRCVDNGQGSFVKYEFSCGEGTVWDQKIEACNHVWAVEKCGGMVFESSDGHPVTTTQYNPTVNDEIDNGYPSIVDPEFDKTTQSTTTHQTTEGRPVEDIIKGNNCLVNGFIGDKNDCKKFYRCVDDGQGSFIRYEFTCGEGTLWDQTIEACNHEWAVKNCRKTGNGISGSSTQVTPSLETDDQEYPQNTDKASTTTTISNYPNADSVNNVCSENGFYGDKNNCQKFYRCVDNGRGGFTRYEFTCGEGTYWNQEILSCDHASSNKTCYGKDAVSSTQIPQYEHDEIYTEATSVSSTLVEENTNGYPTRKPQASSGACTSEGFYGDSNDCKKFYRCVNNGEGGYTKHDFTCGEGTIWDQEIQTCNHESSNKKCSSGPPSDVSQTTENQHEGGNEISMTTTSQIQHATEATLSSTMSSSNECKSEGFFANLKDCRKFIRCVSNDKGGYIKYDFSCGEGTVWVQDILACDHDTGDTNCSSQTSNNPQTTEEYEQTTQKYDPNTSTSKFPTIDKQEDEYDNGNMDKPLNSGSGNCLSEGFYANENDCRQFYRCVDNGQGSYTKYDFTCGEGTAWDANIQGCNHIDQVKTCHSSGETHPIMHDEDDNPSSETSSTMKTTTSESNQGVSSGTSSTLKTTISESSQDATSGTSSTMKTTSSESNQGPTSGSTNTCDAEGYFGNTQDCTKFYRCVDNGKGGYTKYDFTCGEGTIWDQDITTCNHPQDVASPSCNQIQDGSITSTTAASVGSSESSSSSSSPVSQTTTTTTASTQSSSNCSQEQTSKKPGNKNVTCDKEGYYSNPNDCKKFYRCVDWDGNGKKFSVYHFECGEGTIWDPAVETCNHEESVYPPRDCSGSQSQSENQPSTTEETMTSQVTNPSDSTTTEKSSTSQSSTEQTVSSATSEQTSTQQSTTSEGTTTQQSTTSDQTTSLSSTSSEQATTQQTLTSDQTTSQESTASVQTTTTPQSTTSEQATSEQSTQQSSISDSTTAIPSTTSEQTTTQQSTSSEQTTSEQSTTSDQTTIQQSTSSEQTTTQQSTSSEQTSTQQSTSSEQTTTQLSTSSEQTTLEQSTTSEQTTTQLSTSSEQSTSEQSSSSEPSTTELTTNQQSTTESTASEQTTQISTTLTASEQTTTDNPTTSESTTEQSSSTTESSTTDQSTTQQSTTTEQSEPSTTEVSTSSVLTTSEGSTTEQSTTEQTNESSSTESSIDENKKCPETSEDQNLFVCPTSFRRHPKYCNLFYQCDENDDTHDIKIAIFTCPNNTIYDESQTRCVEESKADKKCDGKIAQKRRFKRLDKDYREPIVVTTDSQSCPSAGYYSFENNSECSPAFLKCKTDKTNKLRGLVYQCPPGYIYWSVSKRCELVNNVRDCKRSNIDWTGRWEIPVERRNVAPS